MSPRRIGKTVPAETKAEVGVMNDGLCFQVLKAGELVLNTRAGTLETAKADLQLGEQPRFVTREKNFACFQDELLSLVELYAKQVFVQTST